MTSPKRKQAYFIGPGPGGLTSIQGIANLGEFVPMYLDAEAAAKAAHIISRLKGEEQIVWWAWVSPSAEEDDVAPSLIQ